MYELTFTSDAGDFLAAARPQLAAEPVLNSVLLVQAERGVREAAEGVRREPGRPWWYAIIGDAPDDRQAVPAAVVGTAMRTAPGPRYPLWVQEMPDRAAVQLARALHGRGEVVTGVNGALPAARVVAEELARLTGTTARIDTHTRLFELPAVAESGPVAGELRRAEPDDLELLNHWLTVFKAEADEQAGRPQPELIDHDRDDTRRRIRDGRLWVWQRAGEVVHLTGGGPPSAGVARIGPVFTPKRHRGHGYASAAVAAVSQHFLDQQARVCLFTDQANPVSNEIYQRIGYRPVADMGELIID